MSHGGRDVNDASVIPRKSEFSSLRPGKSSEMPPWSESLVTSRFNPDFKTRKQHL